MFLKILQIYEILIWINRKNNSLFDLKISDPLNMVYRRANSFKNEKKGMEDSSIFSALVTILFAV